MPLKLYGIPFSTCTRTVVAVLAEKGCNDFELVPVDVLKGQQKSPEHVARQPFGQIPVLDHINDKGETFRLYESRAIIRYLDEVLPGPRLTPADPKQRAVMEQWISVETSNITPALVKILMEYKFKQLFRGEPTDQKVADEATAAARPLLDVYEATLSKQPYLAGEHFTLADLVNLPCLQYLAESPGKILIEERPHLADWWKRCSERASWKIAIGKTQ